MKNKVLVAGGPVRMVFNSVVDRLRIACDRRKQRQELIEYLTSDHRAANDLGITPYNVRTFFRWKLGSCARHEATNVRLP